MLKTLSPLNSEFLKIKKNVWRSAIEYILGVATYRTPFDAFYDNISSLETPDEHKIATWIEKSDNILDLRQTFDVTLIMETSQTKFNALWVKHLLLKRLPYEPMTRYDIRLDTIKRISTIFAMCLNTLLCERQVVNSFWISVVDGWIGHKEQTMWRICPDKTNVKKIIDTIVGKQLDFFEKMNIIISVDILKKISIQLLTSQLIDEDFLDEIIYSDNFSCIREHISDDVLRLF